MCGSRVVGLRNHYAVPAGILHMRRIDSQGATLWKLPRGGAIAFESEPLIHKDKYVSNPASGHPVGVISRRFRREDGCSRIDERFVPERPRPTTASRNFRGTAVQLWPLSPSDSQLPKSGVVAFDSRGTPSRRQRQSGRRRAAVGRPIKKATAACLWLRGVDAHWLECHRRGFG